MCPSCGCVFAESKQKLCELTYGFYVTCPQEDCGYEFTDDGEPYEEPTQDDSDYLKYFMGKIRPVMGVIDSMVENGVAFEEE